MSRITTGRTVSVLGLWFLAPFVGEFLLGDFTLASLPLIVPFSLLYGAGAVLVREVGRRTGGWRSMLPLALAYGVLEEGLVDFTLFNPDYLGQHLLRAAHVGFLGMGAEWTVYVLTLHVVWSIATPVLLVEALAGEHRRTPWLGRVGLSVTGGLFVLGCVLTAVFTHASDPFLPSVPQALGSVVVVVLLVMVAVGRRPATTDGSGAVPRPAVVFLATLLLTSAWQVLVRDLGLEAWTTTVLAVLLLAAASIALSGWTRSRGWTDQHAAAVGCGTLLTYAWHAFSTSPVDGGPAALSHLGFALVALVLAGVVQRRTHASVAPSRV